MDLLRNFFKKTIKNEINENTKYDELKDVIERLAKLCNENILDFSIIDEVISAYISSLSESNYSTLSNLFLNELTNIMKESLKRYQTEQLKNGNTNKIYYNLINISLYIMTIIINLKDKRKTIQLFFDKNSKIVKQILETLELTSNFDYNKRIQKIYCNLFLDEYKSLFFDNQLDELFILNNEKFTQINTEGVDVYPKTIYIKLMKYLSRLDMTYTEIISTKKYQTEDKPQIKITLVQSILRVIFSKEKYHYISDCDYEIVFLKNITNKCIQYYRSKYGDKLNCLFREDEIFDDILKYILFISGNFMLYKAMILNIKRFFGSTDEESIKPETFFLFFELFLAGLEKHLPITIKIILKIMIDTLNEYYKSGLNYTALFTYFFFNFLNSPKLQEIYNLNPAINKNVKDVNMILRNIYFNKRFPENDSYSIFNNIIEICHEKLIQLVDKILLDLNERDLNLLIKENNPLINDQPKFIFYHDTSFVLRIFKKVEGFNLHNILIEITPSLHTESPHK